MNTIEDYRASFDLEPGYLDWASFGPPSPAVREEAATDIELLGTGRAAVIAQVAARAAGVPQLVAELIGGRADAVTQQPSTTDGLMQAIFGVTGGLLVSQQEFPSLTIAATRAAETLHVVEPVWMQPPAGYVTPEVVAEALTGGIRALAVSLVDYRTGYRADLTALREVIGDRLMIVDATQGFGVVDADYSAADVVCAHGYKWLRAGRGTAFAWFSDRALEELTPVFSGVTGTDAPGLPEGVPPVSRSAQAFTVSLPDNVAAGRLASALTEIRAAGVAAIDQALGERTQQVLDIAERFGVPTVTPREPQRRAGIVGLTPQPADVAAVAASLANHGISATTRGGMVRLSPHVGTGDDTMTMLTDALAAFTSARSW